MIGAEDFTKSGVPKSSWRVKIVKISLGNANRFLKFDLNLPSIFSTENLGVRRELYYIFLSR